MKSKIDPLAEMIDYLHVFCSIEYMLKVISIYYGSEGTSILKCMNLSRCICILLNVELYSSRPRGVTYMHTGLAASWLNLCCLIIARPKFDFPKDAT